jgi:hypothetical protein
MPDAIDDLRRDPHARPARKRPVEVAVRFAPADGVMATREGDVRYERGDALLTGAAGDRWPMARHRFDAAYEAVAPTAAGAEGTYRKLAVVVHARQMQAPFRVALSNQRGVLHGAAGDWLVQYAQDDVAVVAQSIFAATYELLG